MLRFFVKEPFDNGAKGLHFYLIGSKEFHLANGDEFLVRLAQAQYLMVASLLQETHQKMKQANDKVLHLFLLSTNLL